MNINGSYSTNGVAVLTATYVPLYCAGVVLAAGTKITDTGGNSFTVRLRPACTGVYEITMGTAHASATCVCTVTVLGVVMVLL